MVSLLQSGAINPNETGPQRLQRLKLELHAQFLQTVDLRRLERMGPDDLRQEMRTLVRELVRGAALQLDEAEREQLVHEILADLLGLGPLESLVTDPEVNEILVNGPGRIYVERLGRLGKTELAFRDDEHLMRIIQRLAARLGRRVDERSPTVDARLPDGSRVHIVLPPVALEGAVLSIRPCGPRLDRQEMLGNNTLTPEMLELLAAAVDGRLGVLITGGTGSGKTMLLNMLSQYVPVTELLAIVEECAELKPSQTHVMRFEARPASPDGTAPVTEHELVQTCVRLRADRLILGEARGAEVLDLLLAMKTGQDGSLTTIHANDPRHALDRLEMMALMSGAALSQSAVRQHISNAFALVVHVACVKGGTRRVMRIAELVNGRARDIFRYQETGIENGVSVGEFHATGYKPRCLQRLRAIGINLPDGLFEKRVVLALRSVPPAANAAGPSSSPPEPESHS